MGKQDDIFGIEIKSIDPATDSNKYLIYQVPGEGVRVISYDESNEDIFDVKIKPRKLSNGERYSPITLWMGRDEIFQMPAIIPTHLGVENYFIELFSTYSQSPEQFKVCKVIIKRGKDNFNKDPFDVRNVF